jgi:hypothetical protein
MHVIFENDGEIDAAAIRTFGVSVKEGENPIGFFGTGLKYALAILLRTGHKVTIQSGTSKHRFALKDVKIRGQDFQIVTMDRHELGFTTQVGKTWELWMAYRELYCNCRDESGSVFVANRGEQLPEPAAGKTRVIVSGEDFRNEHDRRSSFLVIGEPWLKLNNCEVYQGESRGVFYRGVLVHRFPKAEVSRFTYNVTGRVDLTEDRTAKNPFMFPYMIASSILSAEDESFLNEVLALDNKYYEHHFDFRENAWGAKPAAPFLKTVEKLAQHAAARTSISAQMVYKAAKRAELAPARTTLVGVESEIMTKAVRFCHELGFDVDAYPIVVTDALGPNILGMAENERIYVSRLALMQGTKRVAGTLIEEFIHLRYSYEDETRAMQEFLLDRLVSVGEQMKGEPL